MREFRATKRHVKSLISLLETESLDDFLFSEIVQELGQLIAVSSTEVAHHWDSHPDFHGLCWRYLARVGEIDKALGAFEDNCLTFADDDSDMAKSEFAQLKEILDRVKLTDGQDAKYRELASVVGAVA